MVAGIVPFAAVVVFEAAILITMRMYSPGIAGGGDALMMALLLILAYLLACMVLVPCSGYLLYRNFTRKVGPTRIQTCLLRASLVVVVAPPLVINLLPLRR